VKKEKSKYMVHIKASLILIFVINFENRSAILRGSSQTKDHTKSVFGF
jgi:hypothetical protein